MEKSILITIPIEEFESRLSGLIDQKLKESQPTGSEFLSIREACKVYDLSQPTIYNWRRQGLIKVYNFSGKAFVSVKEIDESIKKSI